jgi:hypothetical protein
MPIQDINRKYIKAETVGRAFELLPTNDNTDNK